jgi:predicted HicB family RNase H-like nuclease
LYSHRRGENIFEKGVDMCSNAVYTVSSKGSEKMAEKTITIRIDEKLHRDIKIHIAKEQLALKDYIVGLIQKDLYGNSKK